MRKRRDRQTRRREREQSEVDCSEQQIDYCTTYHKIDKGNGFEAKYNFSTESHLHAWPPKLAARYFNMNILIILTKHSVISTTSTIRVKL
jgi:hypothetical protein